MKASLLAISISSVLVAPAFATAPQVNVELANQQTLQLIDGQMKAVDASVQYKLNEQYTNATPGTTATIDDVTYEKQSNGTWAAVGAASAALVAGLLSSSSSSDGTKEPQTPTLPVEATPDNELPISPSISNPIERERPIVDKPIGNAPEFGGDRPELEEPTKPGYNGIEFDRVSDSVINVTKNGVPVGSMYNSDGDWYYRAIGGEPIRISKDLIRPIIDKPIGNAPEFGGDRPELEEPTKPGYNGIEFDRVSDSVINVTKNGVPVGSMYNSDGDWYYRAIGGEPIRISKDLIRPIIDKPIGNAPEFGGDRPELEEPTKPGYNGIEFDRVSDSVINVTKNGVPVGSMYNSDGDWYYRAIGGEPIRISKDLIRPIIDKPIGNAPEFGGDRPELEEPTKPGYNGIEFDRVSDSVINVTKNGVPVGSMYNSDGDWYYRAIGGEPIRISKDLIRPIIDKPIGNAPEFGGDRPELEEPTKPGYNGIEFDRVSDSVINVTKNGVPVGSMYNSDGDWYYRAIGGEPIRISKDLIRPIIDKPIGNAPEFGGDRPEIDAPAKPTISADLEGDNIVVTVNGKSQTTDYTAEADDRGIVHIKDRHGNIVGEGYIDEVNGTVTFGNGIVVNDRGDVTLPPTVKNNVKDKVQSIDPAKLQKAKSAIQQRLRG
ncbi:hypothetical protein L0991_00860 [Vibrio chagasii]|uniref:hypothetical protein n=1 Tax=Vibrio chagasii TaxID=170679 RepID=UPI0035A6D76F